MITCWHLNFFTHKGSGKDKVHQLEVAEGTALFHPAFSLVCIQKTSEKVKVLELSNPNSLSILQYQTLLLFQGV